MVNPLVSIVTPSFNSERFIEETIRSVKGQDYGGVEHIVIDGNSRDRTLGILERHSGAIRLKVEPDGGMYDAINKGMAMAEGEILTYLNSDDTYPDGAVVGDVVAAFEEDPRIDFIYGHCEFVDEDGRLLYLFRAPGFDRDFALAYPRIIFQQPTCFWRRRAHRPFDATRKHCSDAFFFLDLTRNHRGRRLDRTIACFRVRDDSISFKGKECFSSEAQEFQEHFRQVVGHRRSMRSIAKNLHYKFILNFSANLKRLRLRMRGECYW